MNKDDISWNDGNMLVVEATSDLDWDSQDEMPIYFVMLGVLSIAALLGGLVVYLSWRHEKYTKRKRQGDMEKRGEIRSNCLEPRTWSSDGTYDGVTEERSEFGGLIISCANKEQSISASSHSLRSTPLPVSSIEGGGAFNQCRVCEQRFTDHCTILQSNNPQCGHVFHKACMVTWLQKNHKCPICWQILALQEDVSRTTPLAHVLAVQKSDCNVLSELSEVTDISVATSSSHPCRREEDDQDC